MKVQGDQRDTEQSVGELPTSEADTLCLASEILDLVERGLIELTRDKAGDLRCAITELGAEAADRYADPEDEAA